MYVYTKVCMRMFTHVALLQLSFIGIYIYICEYMQPEPPKYILSANPYIIIYQYIYIA